MPRFNVNDYIDVQERINTFWAENPNGAIITDVVFTPDYDHIVIKASIWRDRVNGGLPDATGIAAEERGKTEKDGANFTNWHENCETSAIGRAIANFGYAKTLSERPSRQEMEKVERLSNGAANALPSTRNETGDDRTPGGASKKSFNRAMGIATKQLEMNPEERHQLAEEMFGEGHWDKLNQQQMSALNDQLNLLNGEEPDVRTWGGFWRAARAIGIQNQADYADRLGQRMDDAWSPQEAWSHLQDALAAPAS